MPKSPAFIEMQTAEEIKHRQLQAEKFSLVRQMRDDYAKSVNTNRVRKREESHAAMRTRRETREKNMGRSPSGSRIGGGFTSPYGSRAHLDAAATKRNAAHAEIQKRNQSDRVNKWRESRKNIKNSS